MKFLKYSLLLFILFSSTNLLYAQKDGVQIISPKEFNRIAETNPRAVVIDVRTRKEFKKGHIIYALLAEKSENLYHIIDTTGTDMLYLLYCKDGHRSVDAAKMLFKKYQITSYSLQGGLDYWKELDMKVVK
nr:rhodanese-like domain-containing protein [uncultured Marinifilum sp.]